MRIAIAAPSSVPFRLGGAERAWNGLVRELIQSTPHQADLVKLPAPEQTLIEIVSSYEAFARLDLSSFDLVITTKYPAWITRHTRHVVYLFHPLRALYDLYPAGLPRRVEAHDQRVLVLDRLLNRRPERELLDEVFGRFREVAAGVGEHDPALAFPGPLARQLVHFLDRVALDPRHVTRHLALSRTVAGRRDYFPPGVEVEVLYLPPNLDGFACRDFRYLFTASRLEANKRVDLLVDAMRHVNAEVPVKIGGAGPERDRLHAQAAGDRRIEFLGSLSDSELVRGYADALAVPVVPRNEELGLVTLEAMRSGKPVITCRDSGGPTELVEHARTGLVTDPTPEAVAAAIDRLAADPELARRLGEAGRQRAESFTWHRTVTRLVESRFGPGDAERRPGRLKVVVASIARVHPPRAAAERRNASLAKALASDFDVEIVSLGGEGERASREVVAPGIVETVIPRSRAHTDAAMCAADELDVPLHDLFATTTIEHSPEYVFALARACRSAAMLVLSRPYLQPAVAGLPRPMPHVYFAHRAEANAWEQLLSATAHGMELLEEVRTVEQRSLVDGQGVLVASRDDVPLLAGYGIAPEQLLVAPLGLEQGGDLRAGNQGQARDRWLGRFVSGVAVDRLAVFLGSNDALDIESARRLLEVAAELPNVLHVVVGCEPGSLGEDIPPNVVAMRALARPLQEAVLRAADVSVVPAVHPATRLEFAECLAAGVPCVVTPAGAHGLPVEDGVHALVRELHDFPSAEVRLLEEPQLAERLGREAIDLVEREFDREAAGAAVASVRAAIEMREARPFAANR
jgi:glycosyltransferase involved in cell wall biosynthesis